ncbi:MAG: Tautomerase [uncultured Caballeronia sp.]|nr:MAG: Tautomerase [uncultured Caballeronia sp.]
MKIEERGPRATSDKADLMRLVFHALKDTLGVSDEELQGRYSCFTAADFFAPGGCETSLLIEITLFAGRSLDAKRRLYMQLAHDISRQRGIDPAHVMVLLREEPFDNWGMRGGHAATDLTFDYAIAI